MKLKVKKLLIMLGLVPAFTIPSTLISCSSKIETNYDFGLASASLNSLNYVRFKDTTKVVSAMVEGALKLGTRNKIIQSALTFPQMDLKIIDESFPGASSSGILSAGYYDLKSAWGFLPGTSISSAEGNPITVLKNPNLPTTYLAAAIQLNKKHKWSNGDTVTAQDYIDTLKYILDINTGSQFIIDVQETNIKNASLIVDKQQEYIKKWGIPYKDPFGYDNGWESQNAGDDQDVNEIKEAALGFGVFTKDDYKKLEKDIDKNSNTPSPQVVMKTPNSPYTLSLKKNVDKRNFDKLTGKDFEFNPTLSPDAKVDVALDYMPWETVPVPTKTGDKINYEVTVTDAKLSNPSKIQIEVSSVDSPINSFLEPIGWFDSQQKVADSEVLFIQYEASRPQRVGAILENLTGKNYFKPINRKFVEANGGIYKFGVDKKHFLWNSAFKPTDMYLGPAGYITLEKDQLYYNASRTVSNKVKIFFQSDPMVLASMFNDGYIGQVNIPATHQKQFWGDLSVRPYMKKNGGFGTQAFSLNIDNGNEALKDENFRKAIAYAVDRKAMAKIAAQEASFPVTTWTAFGQATDDYGVPIETYFDNQNYIPYKGSSELPIQSFPFTTHNAKSNSFEQVDRTDIGYNVEIAKHFIEEYKKNNPNQKSVTLKYIYDGQSITKNIGVFLESLLKQAFGDYIKLNIQGCPSNIFETARTTGNYDILFFNYDAYGSEKDSYIKRFFMPDAIDTANQKPTGFRENPSGSFTYNNWIRSKTSAELIDIEERLKIDDFSLIDDKTNKPLTAHIWDKVVELSTQNPSETLSDYKKRLDIFFTGQSQEMIWRQQKPIALVIAAFEKIIREAMPVIPLMEVDTNWEARTIAGVDSVGTYSIQTAYSVINNKPTSLPGVEAIKE